MNYLFLILFFIVGTIFGSFFTVVGLRLPLGLKIAFDRSRCDSCSHDLSPLDMVPILSYLFLKGKCRYCQEKISPISTYVEFFSGILFAVSYYSFGFSLELLLAIGIISLLFIVLVSDLTYLIIPDQVLFFFSIYFIVIQIFNLGLKGAIYHIGIGIFLFLIMYFIMFLGNRIFKRESMGGGDVKLMFLFGLILDPLLGILTIFLGSFFALPLSIYLYISKQEKVIPFGPFLLIAFAFMFFTKLTPENFINWLGITSIFTMNI